MSFTLLQCWPSHVMKLIQLAGEEAAQPSDTAQVCTEGSTVVPPGWLALADGSCMGEAPGEPPAPPSRTHYEKEETGCR